MLVSELTGRQISDFYSSVLVVKRSKPIHVIIKVILSTMMLRRLPHIEKSNLQNSKKHE